MKDEYVMDLSKKDCHCCKQPLTRDYFKHQEFCTNKSCLIRNIRFSIPTIPKEKEKV